MMRQSIIQAALVLLLTVFMSHISEGGETNDAKQIDLTKQLDDIQPSLIENSEFRVARDARRKLRTRRKGNNQNQKQIVEGERKRGKVNKNKEKIKKKTRQNKMNRRKFKKKEKKNKEKNTKYKKKSTKTEKKSKPNKSKHNSEHSKKKKKKSEQKKKSRKNKKKLRKKSKNSIQQKSMKDKLSKLKSKQGCDEKVLCQKIKDFIKYFNQMRKVRRIIKACDTMEKKAIKSASEFEATVTSLEKVLVSVSGRKIDRSRHIKLENLLHTLGNARWRRNVAKINDVNVYTIKDKLQGCPITAKNKCQKSSVEPCQDSSLLTRCNETLTNWTLRFGPSKGSCLNPNRKQASDDCCTCITGLPLVPDECLHFDDKSEIAVKSKKKCANKDEEGSFGYCRYLQREAAVKGPQHVKDNCYSSDYVTKGPSGGSTTTVASTSSVNPTTSTARSTVCTPKQCGVKKQDTKIIGGTDATVKPWTATIQKLRCGGSVIANNWIMTAAHCFYNTDGGLSITNHTIGENPIKVGENLKELIPEKLFIHLQFKYRNPNHLNDIALVKVPAIDFTPVCLPTRNNYDGDKATVYGWGSDDKFQALDVTIQSDDAARQAYQNTISPLTNSQLRVMVFAGGEKDKDACVGDDGGPLIVGNELVGIVSWGLGCGVQGLPRAYTEVAFFKDWIIEKTNICI